MKPRVLSLFSGIGGFDLGLERAGFEVAAQVEIDPYCRSVLERHWPNTVRYEDVRDVGMDEERSGAWLRGAVERDSPDASGSSPKRILEYPAGSIDLICGGFPCQDLSVAGRRAGLDGARSGLWFEFQRILQELRPAWCLIENVPGLLSSNGGRDFAVLLDGLGECGFGGIAWAVLDSQHFGVAQRRRRVFIVGGPTRRSAEQVLSLCEGCGGHPAPRRTQREDVAYSLGAGTYDASWKGADRETYVPSGRASDAPDGRAGSSAGRVGAGAGAGGRGHETYVPRVGIDIAGALQERDYKGPGGVFNGEVQGVVAVRTAQTSSNGGGVNEEGTAYTLDGAQGQAVAFAENQRGELRTSDVSLQLTTGGGKPRQGYPAAFTGASVRRLTPVECERLQGFPDDWTDVGDLRYRGAAFANKGTSDGPRYRALGNAVTVPVIEYLGLRLMEVMKGV